MEKKVVFFVERQYIYVAYKLRKYSAKITHIISNGCMIFHSAVRGTTKILYSHGAAGGTHSLLRRREQILRNF